jgi:hypothetical protein
MALVLRNAFSEAQGQKKLERGGEGIYTVGRQETDNEQRKAFRDFALFA